MHTSVARLVALFILLPIATLHQGWAQSDDRKALNQQVVEHLNSGKYSEALNIAEQALKLSERQLSPDHPDVGMALNNLAEIYRAQGRYAEAEPLYKRYLKIAETALGSDHPDFGTTLSDLALLYLYQGRYAEAEPLFERSLMIFEKALGPEHPHIGVALSNIAVIHKLQGRYAEAELFYKRTLRITEAALGRTHPNIGGALNNLADLYHAQGRYAEAELLFKRTLNIAERALGSDHPNFGTTLNNLAEVYKAQGRYAEAEPLYKRYLKITETALGSDHPNVGMPLSNLALLHLYRGRYAEAEPLFKRSLSIRERILPPDHPDVSTSLSNLAGLYMRQGRYAEAEPLFKRSLSIRERILPPDHPVFGMGLNNLAGLYSAQGRYAEAEPLYKRYLEITETALGSDHSDVGVALNNLAGLYKKVGRASEESALRKRLARMPPRGTRHVPLFLITNRDKDRDNSFGSALVNQASFGLVTMRVPTDEVKNRARRISENLGQLDKAKTGKLTAAKVLKFVRLRRLSGIKEFARSIKANQERAAIFRNQALIFLHGYNNDFEGAMQRATQVSFDLQFDGILMPFTWPSQGTVSGYYTDRKMALNSVDALVRFLDQIHLAMPHITTHLLAHSMGNEVMLRALCKIAKRKDDARHNFGQVIAAHPDVDLADFDKLTICFKERVAGITLYVNEKDTALRVRCGGFRCRAGNFARGYSAADVIDTTAMGKGFWRTLAKGFDHDVFVRNPLLFGDITRLLLTGLRPIQKRTPEFRPRKDSDDRTYWVYDKSLDPAENTEVASGQ